MGECTEAIGAASVSAPAREPQPVASDFTIETVSDFHSFLALEAAWNDLVEQAEIEHPFLEHAWVRTWWECFGADKELHILLVRSGKSLVGIAPLMLSHSRVYGLRVRRLGFIYNVHTPRFDFIVAGGRREVYDAIWDHLTAKYSRWDILRLCQLAEGSQTVIEMARFAERSGYRVGLWPSGESPYVRISGTWDSYFNERSRNHRADVRKKMRRLTRLGSVELQVFQSPEDEDCLNAGLTLEAAAWKGRAGTAIQSTPQLRQFYSLLARRMADAGILRLHFLTVNGQKVAFDYSLYYRSTIYVLKLGWDPQFASYSPYKLLCGMVLQRAFEHGMREYDFLGLNYGWKLHWTRDTRRHYWLHLFAPNWTGRVIHFTKFRLLPGLQRQRSYELLRDFFAGRGRHNPLD